LFTEAVQARMQGFPKWCAAGTPAGRSGADGPATVHAGGLAGAAGIAPAARCPYLGRAAALATASAVMLNTRRTVAAGVRM